MGRAPLPCSLYPIASAYRACMHACTSGGQVGDCFNHGLVDIQLDLRRVPLLEWAPPPVVKYALTADDVMNRSVVCMYTKNKVCARSACA